MWTGQHLDSPHNRPRADPDLPHNIRDRLYSIVSIPRTTEFTPSQRFSWSVFYTASVTFPFVVTFLYWTVLEDGFHGRALNGNALHDCLIYSVYAVNSVIAIGEIVLLSSVHQVIVSGEND